MTLLYSGARISIAVLAGLLALGVPLAASAWTGAATEPATTAAAPATVAATMPGAATNSATVIKSDIVPGAERDPAWARLVDKSSNLHQVSDSFLRSARLTKTDLALLKSMGVRTVVNLRSFHSDAGLLKNSGIKMVRVPINTWAISDAQVVTTLKAIRAAEREGPVLLHCLHGADRTGLMTAMYRMVFQDWERARAIDELKNGGYGYHVMWKNIDNYLAQVDVAAIRQRVLAP